MVFLDRRELNRFFVTAISVSFALLLLETYDRLVKDSFSPQLVAASQDGSSRLYAACGMHAFPMAEITIKNKYAQASSEGGTVLFVTSRSGEISLWRPRNLLGPFFREYSASIGEYTIGGTKFCPPKLY